MAEKQFALGGTRSVGFQEEDDPLAELARIVGFQEPSANRSVRAEEQRVEPVITEFPVAPPQGAVAPVAGPNPVADLEDELLRAFETYDGPRAETPAAPVAAPEAPAAPQAVASGPALNEDDDPFAALAAVVAQSEAVSRVAPVKPQPQPQQPVEPRFTEMPKAEPAAEQPADFSVELLEAELLQSLDEAELDWGVRSAVEPVQPEVSAKPAFAPPAVSARSEFRMPLANFHVASQPAAKPAPANDAPLKAEPVAWDLPGGDGEDLPATPSRPIAASSHEAEAPVLRPEPALAAEPVRRETPRVDPVFGASLEAITNVAADVRPQARSEEPFGFNLDSPADEPDFDDLFSSGEFELDLDDFEQQLTEIAKNDTVAAAPAAPQPEARRAFADFVPEKAETVKPAEPATFREPAFEAAPRRERFQPAPQPVLSEPVPPVMPAAPQPAFTSPLVEPMDFDNGLFDPALLSETDDPVEAVADFDVPELKMPEPEEPAVVVPDYDLDIDAEMANLFTSLPPLGASIAEKKPVSEPAAPRPFGAPATGSQKAAVTVDSFDDFEKALEEDFRSMLSQPLGQEYQPRPRMEPQMVPVSPPRHNNFRSILLAACATGAVALVGLGGFMLLSGKGGVMASGEPKVIMADKGPVKVVPENKGGVTVPNQDKAVYDRVAGNGDDTVKQGALITSEEEPVDVVQKTLMPENTDETAMNAPVAPTPVEDTKDARLLPATDKPDNQDAAANVPGGVQVRKVKTMIVKADGTLVPREEEPVAPSAEAPVAAAEAPVPPPANETTAAVPQDRIKPPLDENGASTDALAKVANTPVAGEAAPAEVPVKTVKTSKLADVAPVPTARPADQPVNVVGTVTESGKVKPGQQEAAPQETASIDPVVAKPASGSYGIQIASLPSEADAKASIAKMSSKFGGVLGGRAIGIRQANIPNKGTYYRLRVDVGSKDEAIALCSKLKAAGGSCLVSK